MESSRLPAPSISLIAGRLQQGNGANWAVVGEHGYIYPDVVTRICGRITHAPRRIKSKLTPRKNSLTKQTTLEETSWLLLSRHKNGPTWINNGGHQACPTGWIIGALHTEADRQNILRVVVPHASPAGPGGEGATALGLVRYLPAHLTLGTSVLGIKPPSGDIVPERAQKPMERGPATGTASGRIDPRPASGLLLTRADRCCGVGL